VLVHFPRVQHAPRIVHLSKTQFIISNQIQDFDFYQDVQSVVETTDKVDDVSGLGHVQDMNVDILNINKWI
jgi:hypothetical protein